MDINIVEVYRNIAKLAVKITYDVNFIGFEKIPKVGPAILIANHVSYVDGLIINAACPRPVRFIIDEYIYKKPIINYFMTLDRVIPILPKKESVKHALDQVSLGLDKGDLICIFPEGQLTYTGNLGRFKPGIEWIIDRDPVPIYPIAIKGLWDSIFSRKYVKSRWRMIPKNFRMKVTAVCGDPIQPADVNINNLQRAVLNLKSSIHS